MKFNFNYFLPLTGTLAPKPHKYVSHSLQSSLITDLSDTINSINSLMPQLTQFIGQFNSVVVENGINVLTDINGNMSIDVPGTMSDSDAQNLSQRISVIDRVITTRGQEINELLQKGLAIEKEITATNSNFTSQILPKINEFNRLNASYRH